MKYCFYAGTDALRYHCTRLPSGFGSVRFLGPGRANPYAVHPPMFVTSENKLKRPPAICYVSDRITGIKILVLYHNNLYSPGLEKNMKTIESLFSSLIKNNKEKLSGELSEYCLQNVPQVSEREFPVEGDAQPASQGNMPNIESLQPSQVECRENAMDGHRSHSMGSTDKCRTSRKSTRLLESDKSNEIEESTNLAALNLSNISWPISSKRELLHLIRAYFDQAVQELAKDDSFTGQDCGNAPDVRSDNQIIESLSQGVPSLPQKEAGSPLSGVVGEKTGSSMPSLREIYRDFFRFKYGEHAARRLSRSSRNASEAAYKKLESFYERTLDDITVVDLQNLVNLTASQGYSRSAVTDLVTLIRQLYRFAYPREMCSKEYGKYVLMPYTAEEKHHQAFNDKELGILWKYRDDPIIRMVLIMCYSGFRISEFSPENGLHTLIIPENNTAYFQGGIKTKAGKDRIVPIHSAILPLVKRIKTEGDDYIYLCGRSTSRFRDLMKNKLVEIGIDTKIIHKNHKSFADKCVSGKEVSSQTVSDAVSDKVTSGAAVFCKKNHYEAAPETSEGEKNIPSHLHYHTPHSCRHTFSRLCESYGVNEADRKRMMGHAFGNDLANGVYCHRSVQ